MTIEPTAETTARRLTRKAAWTRVAIAFAVSVATIVAIRLAMGG